MTTFRWLSACALPPRYDLRQRDWALVDEQAAGCAIDAIALVLAADAGARGLPCHTPSERAAACVLDVADAAARAMLLHAGYGDAFGPGTSLDELDIRARRLRVALGSVPRLRHAGALTLDLIARDAFVADAPLRLHPREFDLLWRLADQPGASVAKEVLIQDVWRLEFQPETNSLAVHVSRVRTKLNSFGLAALLETAPGGAYRLNIEASADHSGQQRRMARSASGIAERRNPRDDRHGAVDTINPGLSSPRDRRVC